MHHPYELTVLQPVRVYCRLIPTRGLNPIATTSRSVFYHSINNIKLMDRLNES